jgi:hypothetical protein
MHAFLKVSAAGIAAVKGAESIARPGDHGARRRQGAGDIVPPQATPPEFGGSIVVTPLYQAPLAQRTKGFAHGLRVEDRRIDPPYAAPVRLACPG